MTQYAIKERSEGASATGPFLRLTLTNKQGDIKAVYWSVPDAHVRQCMVGAVIEPAGELGEYKGDPQLKISDLRVVPDHEIAFEDLLPESPADRMIQRHGLEVLINLVADPDLRYLLTRNLLDTNSHVATAYHRWPAAVSYHHAWVGGLLDHSLQVAEIALRIAEQWPKITDSDIIIVGALLHDIGKLMEIRMGATFEFTTAGRLSGHVLLGIQWLRAAAEDYHLAPHVYEELEHIIASHHGQVEWGAIVPPRTANAVAVHLADLASARMTGVWQALTSHTGDAPWTPYDRMTKTQFYLGPKPSSEGEI